MSAERTRALAAESALSADILAGQQQTFAFDSLATTVTDDRQSSITRDANLQGTLNTLDTQAVRTTNVGQTIQGSKSFVGETRFLILYFGNPSSNGSWRIQRIFGRLVFQRRGGGTWNNKLSINPN